MPLVLEFVTAEGQSVQDQPDAGPLLADKPSERKGGSTMRENLSKQEERRAAAIKPLRYVMGVALIGGVAGLAAIAISIGGG